MVYQYNKPNRRNFQLYTHGNSGYLFSNCWNWQICHTHWAFKLPLRTFSGKIQTFPMAKSKTIGFLLDQTQQHTPVLFGKTPRELLPGKELWSSHYVAYLEVAGMCYTRWCTWLHYVCFENCWKHLIGRMTSSVTDVHLKSRFSRKR